MRTFLQIVLFFNTSLLFSQSNFTLSDQEYQKLHLKSRLLINSDIDSSFIVATRIEKSNNNLHKSFAYGIKSYLYQLKGDSIKSKQFYKQAFTYLDKLRVTAEAWRGKHIDQAMLAFMQAAATPPAASGREMVMFVGHDGLMDAVHAKLPQTFAKHTGHAKQAAVLACYSDRFFRSHLVAAGAQPSVTTYSLMAPEGYVVEAIARSFATGGDPTAQRRAAGLAYAQYQRITPRAGLGVFGVK